MFEDEFFVREQDESGQWAMSTGENALQLGSDRFEFGRGATVELYRSVPIPSRDVPLEDILEFKNKRKSEVVEFTIAVDKFYSSWTNSEDQDFQLNLAKQEIEKRCSDLIKTTKEAKFPFIPSSWSVSYSLNTGTAAAIAALVASYSSGLPMVESSRIALAAGAAGFGMDFGFGPKKEKGSMSPFRYAASIEKDMF